MGDATLKQVADYFVDKSKGETLTKFSAEWKLLSDKDKQEIRTGLGDGSLTY